VIEMAKARVDVSAVPSMELSLIGMDLVTVDIKVQGLSGLIVHAWSEKSKRQMLDKQMGVASKGKARRNPQEEYEAAFHRLPNGTPGFPALGFKAATVTAVTSLGKDYTKVMARQAFHFVLPTGCDLVEIHHPKDTPPVMRQDICRIGISTAENRFRPEFSVWGAVLRITHNQRAMSTHQLINLINLGGFSVGVGEWRPERDGDKGRYEVVNKFSWEK